MSAARNTWATFWVDGEMFAFDVGQVQEVLMRQPLTPVPLAPKCVLGLLNLRGQIMPVVDLRCWLGGEATPPNHGRLLVVRSNETALSVVVDDIGDVLHIDPDAWRPLPETVTGERRRAVLRMVPIDGRIVLELDIRLLTQPDPSEASS